jgi:DNA oxidative demethylase
VTPLNPGLECIEEPGFSYLPDFITQEESTQLLNYFATLKPIWEQRHIGAHAGKGADGMRRLSRPVYWLGAWQFACLGYYAEPQHLYEKCLQAEPFPAAINVVLSRLQPRLANHQTPEELGSTPNTCLVNFYGSEQVPDAKGRLHMRDYARLKMHKDGEPGPVVMFSLGHSAIFEFVDPEKPQHPTLSLKLNHRSVVILSGPHFKDYLYHRVTRVFHKQDIDMPQVLNGFSLRRISVSFRSVPPEHILPLNEFGLESRTKIHGYVKQLAQHSEHFRRQLDGTHSAQ